VRFSFRLYMDVFYFFSMSVVFFLSHYLFVFCLPTITITSFQQHNPIYLVARNHLQK
jgi:hypothetical protein